MAPGVRYPRTNPKVKNGFAFVDSGPDQRRLAIVCGCLPASNSVKAGDRHRLCIITDYATSKLRIWQVQINYPALGVFIYDLYGYLRRIVI